jgi:hypothetical protein
MTLPKFEVGDLAEHKFRNLDARPVHSVEGTRIRLYIGGTGPKTVVTDPVPASNYRRVPKATLTNPYVPEEA